MIEENKDYKALVLDIAEAEDMVQDAIDELNIAQDKLSEFEQDNLEANLLVTTCEHGLEENILCSQCYEDDEISDIEYNDDILAKQRKKI